MKQFKTLASSAPDLTCSAVCFNVKGLFLTFSFFLLFTAGYGQQAVSGIITDYNSFWKTRAGSYNPIKPSNSHNLLAFTFNNQQFSTGVNDGALSSMGETFVAGDFWSLPVDLITGTVSGNTKVGVGQLYDGVNNGAGTVPSGDLKSYLSDGIRGLNIGTCVANLPAGDLTFFVSNINPAHIGDGIPDVVVTQVADPSSTYDRYSFVDNSGNVIGASRDIVFTNIPGIGNWTADFWEASQNPMALAGGFTNTDRVIRLWAADLSEFGITASNYNSIRKFKIRLSGDSDVAFVAYNRKTISITSVLPLKLHDFTARSSAGKTVLNWNTSAEMNSDHFIVEKKLNDGSFFTIDSVTATGTSTSANYYTSTDKNVQAGTSYYRLRMVDADGAITYSKTILVSSGEARKLTVNIFPNPATTNITVEVPSGGRSSLEIYSASGQLVNRITLSGSSTRINVPVNTLDRGIYHLVWNSAGEKINQSFVIK
ncbi:MAG: T9SS type A sorting domain-containing protein [Chitinophagaceae bacterium]